MLTYLQEIHEKQDFNFFIEKIVWNAINILKYEEDEIAIKVNGIRIVDLYIIDV
jgi:hypothetical protein